MVDHARRYTLCKLGPCATIATASQCLGHTGCFFNSQTFLLLFLPPTLAGYYFLAQHRTQREWQLIAVSLFFFGYWNPLHYTSEVADRLASLIIRGANAEPAPNGECDVLAH